MWDGQHADFLNLQQLTTWRSRIPLARATGFGFIAREQQRVVCERLPWGVADAFFPITELPDLQTPPSHTHFFIHCRLLWLTELKATPHYSYANLFTKNLLECPRAAGRVSVSLHFRRPYCLCNVNSDVDTSRFLSPHLTCCPCCHVNCMKST